MGLSFKFITSTDCYDVFHDSVCVPIEFIGLLTSITFRTTHFLLELQNYTKGTPDALPYLVKLRCSDRDSKKLARITLSLLFQMFNVDLPEAVLDDDFTLENIHYTSLCFLRCKCLYVSSGSKYSVFLDDVQPLSLSTAIEKAVNAGEDAEAKVFSDIFQSLLIMDHDSKNSFKFNKLSQYDESLSKFINTIRKTEPRMNNNTLINNPFFTVNRLALPEDSQNEFNSQFMGTAGSFDTLGVDLIEESDSSIESLPSDGRQKKRFKTADLSINPEVLLSAKLGAVYKLSGRIVGMYPNRTGVDYKASSFRIYFIPDSWSYDPNTLIKLIPSVNCLEIVVEKGTKMDELFVSINESFDSVSEILMQSMISIVIKRTKWQLKGELHSSQWILTGIEEEHQISEKLQKPFKSISAKKDPFVSFKNLTLNSHEVKYVTMIGLLVSCSFENPSFASLVFTDFTDNAVIQQKYLFDRFLIDFDNKLGETNGFRTIIYPNQFEQFDRLVTKEYGYPIRRMFQNGTGENLSHKGIVCRMSLKIKMFNDKMNAIIRECVPITNQTYLPYNDERQHLKSFHNTAIQKLKQSAIRRYYNNYTKCFPLTTDLDGTIHLKDSSVANGTSQHQGAIPDLHIDDISQYELADGCEIPLLNLEENITKTLYKVEGQVIGLDLQPDHLRIHLTNDIISKDYVDPTRIVTIEVPTRQNLQYFFNNPCQIDETHIASLRELILGEEVSFKISRGKLPLRAPQADQGAVPMAMIWCPIECSYDELRSQLRHPVKVKLET